MQTTNPLGVDHVMCLTLDRRLEMANELAREFTNRGYSFEKFIGGNGQILPRHLYSIIDSDEYPEWFHQSICYPTWFKRPNAANAFRAHKRMMEICLERQYESVLFIEDDSKLMNNFDTALSPVEEFARENEWSLFYLGNFFNSKKAVMVHPLVATVDSSCMGFHAIALKKHVIEKLVKWPMYGPMDYLCNEYINKYFPAYACVPPLIVQRGGFSYVENHFLGRRVEDNYH